MVKYKSVSLNSKVALKIAWNPLWSCDFALRMEVRWVIENLKWADGRLAVKLWASASGRHPPASQFGCFAGVHRKQSLASGPV
jgi:hypothetical protein